MNSKRVFLIVFLPITLIILVVGEVNVATGGFPSSFLVEGIIIYGLYGALIGAVVGGIAAGIHHVVAGRKTPSAIPAPSSSPMT